MSQQSLMQASVRAVTSTTLTYEGDWHALFDSLSIAAGDYNGRMLQYINLKLGTSYTNINSAMAALAANAGATTFQAIGTFTASVLTAPVLAFVSATDPDSDNTQDYLYTLTNPAAGDKIYTCAKIGGFSIANDPNEFDVRDIHILTQLEIDTLSFPVSLTLTPDGSWSTRAFHERSGTFSNASNVATKQITTVSYEPESETIFSAFTTPPDDTRKGHIDDLVVALKTASVWTKLDALYLFAAADSQAALINWKTPGTFNASLVNAPSFAADRGFTGNGTSSYVDSNFNPSTAGGNFAQNSACFAAWSRTAAAAAGSVVDAGWISTNGTILRCRALSGDASFRINQGSSNVIAVAGGDGLFSANRSAAGAVQSYRNGASIGTNTTASTAMISHSLCFGTSDGSTFSPRQWAGGFISSSLNSTEQDAIYDAMLVYMQAVGAA